MHSFTPFLVRYVALFLGVCQIGLAQTTDDKQRYMGLQMLNLETSPTAGLDVIQQSVGYGCNLVAITIYWGHVYPTADSPADWRQADNQIKLITQTGAKVAIRIMLGRTRGSISGFWTPKEGLQDDIGQQAVGIYGYTSFSYAHQPSVQKAQKFIKEVCERYNYLQVQDKLLYVSFVNTPAQELGYDAQNWPDGDNKKARATPYDYSPESMLQFRAWLMQKYKRLSRLNYVWTTRFPNEKDIMGPQYAELRSFKTLQGKDFYVFNHLLIKNYINQNIEIIKKVNPTYRVVNEYGSVADEGSGLRTTLCFKDLDKNAEGTKIHNDPYMNHAWFTDVQRSSTKGKWIMNEVFYTPETPAQLLIKQFDQCFEHGCKIVTMVVSTVDGNTRNIFEPIKNRWLTNPLTEVRSQASYQYAVSSVLDSASIGSFIKAYDKVAGTGTANPKIVDVQLVEDILADEYWRKWLVNVPPVVNYSLGDRAGKPRKVYNYTVPKDLFTDPDGNITKIEALEKPAWLSFENSQFTGNIPDAVADYKITLRATDDDGATAQTSFLIKITNINVKPVVRNPVPNFTTYLQQLVFYQFQGGIFDDPDGKIIGVRAFGLRSWMLYNPNEFSAFPDEFGTFPVRLRAYDDDSAYVETTFFVQVLNRPPVVVRTLSEKVIAQGKPFRYRISKDIFNDPDGRGITVKVLNRPAWMAYDGNEISGTPPQLESYRLIIRGFDSQGDSTETALLVRVDTRGNLNAPPLVRGKIPDAQVFVTQQFSYRIPDTLFFDANGYIDRIEIPNLPNWLQFKNNTLTGIAKESGTYTVIVRATDDDESSVSISFKIEVRLAQLTFELIQAGKVGTRRLVGPLRNGDQFTAATLPDRITIYANCDVPAKRVVFNLTGPYRKRITVSKFPFALFDDETGFVPVAGQYVLKAEAFGDSLKVSETSIGFEIQTSQTLTEWQIYPNPFDEVCNLKLSNQLNINELSFSVVNLTGQRVFIPSQYVSIVGQVAYIDMGGLQLVPGVYLLQVLKDGVLEKVVKIIKR